MSETNLLGQEVQIGSGDVGIACRIEGEKGDALLWIARANGELRCDYLSKCRVLSTNRLASFQTVQREPQQCEILEAAIEAKQAELDAAKNVIRLLSEKDTIKEYTGKEMCQAVETARHGMTLELGKALGLNSAPASWAESITTVEYYLDAHETLARTNAGHMDELQKAFNQVKAFGRAAQKVLESVAGVLHMPDAIAALEELRRATTFNGEEPIAQEAKIVG